MRPLFIVCLLIIPISILFISCQKSNLSIDEEKVIPTIGPNLLSDGWTYQQPEFVKNTPIPDIFFLDTKYGAFITNKDLYITDNGGLNWNPYVNKNFINQGTGIFNMFITPGKDIYMIGNQYLYRVRKDSMTTLANNFIGSDIYFINDKIGYISNSNGALTSIDSGKTWKPLNLKFSLNNSRSVLSSLSFLSNGKGLITSDKLCANNFINDTSWIVQEDQNLLDIIASYIVTKNLLFLSTSNGIYRSLDGAKTFKKVYTFSKIEGVYIDIHFVNDKIGYFCRGNRIYRTTDGGDNWSVVVRLTQNKDESIIELHFTSPNNGWACTSKGGILKYTL